MSAAGNQNADAAVARSLPGVEMIRTERERQINQEGCSAEHDDSHTAEELAEAAMCYACVGVSTARGGSAKEWPVRMFDGFSDSLLEWPWNEEDWRPSDDPILNLLKAGALIAAEIDRLQRKKAMETGGDR